MKPHWIVSGVVLLLGLLLWSVTHRGPPLPPSDVGPAPVSEPTSAPPTPNTGPIHRASSGRLELVFLDRTSRMPGVEAEILGDSTSVRVTSNESGLIARDLPDGRYRWRLLSDEAFSVLPMDAEAAFERGETRTSGEIQIRSGETVRHVMHLGDCIVHGKVVDYQGRPIDTELRLLSENVRVRADQKDYDARWLTEKTAQTSGAFRFERLLPGTTFSDRGEQRRTAKVLWLRAEQGRHVYTARRWFSAQPGQTIDLGTIILHRDHTLAIEVAFEDPRGEANQPFVADTDVWIQILRSTSVPMSEEVSEDLLVRAGTTWIHGLSHGTYDVELDEPHLGWPPLKPGYKLLETSQFEEAITIPGRARLIVTSDSGAVPVHVLLSPIHHDESQILLWAQSDSGGLEQIKAKNFHTEDQGSFVGGEFSLLPGEYIFSASNNHADNPPDHVALFCEKSQRISNESSVILTLGRGSHVSGRLSHPQGRPVTGKRIKFTDPRGRRFTATAGADGRFRVSGLPPGGSVTAYGRAIPCGTTGVRLDFAWDKRDR